MRRAGRAPIASAGWRLPALAEIMEDVV